MKKLIFLFAFLIAASFTSCDNSLEDYEDNIVSKEKQSVNKEDSTTSEGDGGSESEHNLDES